MFPRAISTASVSRAFLESFLTLTSRVAVSTTMDATAIGSRDVTLEETIQYYQQQKQLSKKQNHQNTMLYHHSLEQSLQPQQKLNTNSNQNQIRNVPGATSVLLSFLNDVGDNVDFSNDFFFPGMEMDELDSSCADFFLEDNHDENNENIINTQVQQVDIIEGDDDEAPLESEPPIRLASSIPAVFRSNPQLNTIFWDIEEENITIDEELRQRRKKKRIKETHGGFPPMYDDIVADELEEEYASRYGDFYEYDSISAPQMEDSFLQSAASVTSLVSMIDSEIFGEYLSDDSSVYRSCPSTPSTCTTKSVLTISASSKRKRHRTDCNRVSPPSFIDDPYHDIDINHKQCIDNNNNDGGDIYGKEYITGSDGVIKEFQTLRAAFTISKKMIPKKTTFLTPKQLKKKYKQSPEVKLKNVVSMLKQVQYVMETASSKGPSTTNYQDQNTSVLPKMNSSSKRLFTKKDLLERTEIFLAHILGAKVISLPDLLKVASGSMTLKNKPLASFHDQLKYILMADKKKGDLMKYDTIADTFPIARNTEFPDMHRGIGQVNAASRSFVNLMSDLLTPQLVKEIKFSTYLSQQSAIVNSKSDQLSSQFSWQTSGMKDMGYAEELSFNGLIRCTFNNTGMISACTISYDCCTIVRSFFQKPPSECLFSTQAAND